MAKKREEFEDRLKWNVKDLYPSVEAFTKDYEFLEKKIIEFAKYKNHILDSADTLYELLSFDNEFNKKLEQVYIYAHIQNDQDTTNTFFQTMYGKVYKLYEKYQEETSFIVPELLKGNYEVILSYIKKNKKLKEYERELKEIFKFKDYTLSDKEEKILSSMTSIFKTPDDIYSMLSDADMCFGTILDENGKKSELNEKSYRKFIESSNRKVRKNAFKKLLTTYGNFKNTYASLLTGEVRKNNKIATVRGYKSALSASLFANDIPEEIYTNLINTVKNNVEPLSRFWKLKKEALGVPALHIYDTYAPITKETNHHFTEEEAKNIIISALSVLGDDYIKHLNRAFDEAWIDYSPNEGKRNGAYCTAC